MSILQPREPFNAWSHGLGAILAVVGLVAALARAPDALTLATFAIYGVTMVALLVTSTAVHVSHDLERVERWDRWDRVWIYLFIAGTYTALCPQLLRGGWLWGVLVAIWVEALLGAVVAILALRMPRWFSTALYVAMGWTVLVAIVPIFRALDGPGVALFLGAALSYTGGAVVFALKRPDPWSGVVGFHGLWHLAVLGGMGLHYALVMRIV